MEQDRLLRLAALKQERMAEEAALREQQIAQAINEVAHQVAEWEEQVDRLVVKAIQFSYKWQVAEAAKTLLSLLAQVKLLEEKILSSPPVPQALENALTRIQYLRDFIEPYIENLESTPLTAKDPFEQVKTQIAQLSRKIRDDNTVGDNIPRQIQEKIRVLTKTVEDLSNPIPPELQEQLEDVQLKLANLEKQFSKPSVLLKVLKLTFLFSQAKSTKKRGSLKLSTLPEESSLSIKPNKLCNNIATLKNRSLLFNRFSGILDIQTPIIHLYIDPTLP